MTSFHLTIMRFNAAAVLSTALIAGAVHAQGDNGAQAVLKDAEASASASAKSVVDAATGAASSVVESAALPTFTVSFT